MASAKIALACDLKVRVGCQKWLCVNSDADKTLGKADYATEVLPRSCENINLICLTFFGKRSKLITSLLLVFLIFFFKMLLICKFYFQMKILKSVF